MSRRDELRAAPNRFDLFTVLRELERSAPDKPRIGDSRVPAEDIVVLGQDPFLEFPDSNLSGYEERQGRAPLLKTRFLGFFGPQGALPLASTVEAHGWAMQHDPSFARFTDIVASRFRQLFFRAWADARPIAQHERPAADRFLRYVGSIAGIGSEAYIGRGPVHDIAKAGFAGLVGSRVKSAVRLRQMLEHFFRTKVEIVERVGSWLVFEPGDRMALGASGSSLGQDTFVGTRVHSINEKFRIRISAESLEQYRDLLPGGKLSRQLIDLVIFHIGHRFEFDVELGLRVEHAPAVRLGQSGELGWTSWVAPARPGKGETAYFHDARFNPMERHCADPDPRRGRSRPARPGGKK